MDFLGEYDAECFPTLKSALELDGITVKDLLQKFSYQQCDYAFKVKQGWFEEFTYSGLSLTVLIHGESKQFAWKDVNKWVFYPNVKKIDDPDFEIWMKDKIN
jgi:hypothetical protein